MLGVLFSHIPVEVEVYLTEITFLERPDIIEVLEAPLFDDWLHVNNYNCPMQNKSVQYEEYKKEKFEEISADKTSMFNFFLENNDIFGFINPEDEMVLK